jgi:hypothetical protein
MFNLEKEMIPVLRSYLSERYNVSDNNFISEFDSGNGIADLVFITERNEEREALQLDYELIFVALKYFDRKNKKIIVDKFCTETHLNKKRTLMLLNSLMMSGLLEKVNDREFFVKKRYSSPVKKIVSIEAKLYDWRGGLCQALRYKTYSHESYLAISHDYSHRVDIDLLRKNNIGLIVVSPNKITIALKVKKETPSNRVAHAYLSEKLLQMTLA